MGDIPGNPVATHIIIASIFESPIPDENERNYRSGEPTTSTVENGSLVSRAPFTMVWGRV